MAVQLSIQKRLGLILVITSLFTVLLVVGLFQMAKGARFHYLNALHLKHVLELTEHIEPSVQGLPVVPDLRRMVNDIRQQPVECLQIVNGFDRAVMRLIGTGIAIDLCEQDIAEADRLLAGLDRYERGQMDADTLYAQLRDGCTQFRKNSDQFLQPITATTDFIISGTFSLFAVLATAMLLGTLLLMRGIAVTLHRQRQMENGLRESEERWKFALEGAGDGVWDWNIATGEVLYSKRFKEMLGYAEHEFSNRLQEWQERVHPDDLPRVMAEVQAYFDGRVAHYAIEHRVRCKDSSWKWMLDRGMVVSRDAAGQPLRMIGTHTDITERVTAEEERQLLENELRQSQKLEAIGTLAGGIAHDFNNVLGAILGNVELARQDLGGGHPALESLEQIRKSGERARDLVQQILIFSRKQSQQFCDLALGAAVADSVKLLRATIPAGVALETTLADTPLYVHADESQMHQVLLNLCINAWQAMEGQAGRIDIVVEAVELDAATAARLPGLQAGRHAHLSIRDDGQGMDETTQTRLFEPFFTTKPVGQGTGLGLAVVHGIVQAHHGAIAVRSAVGKGTTFDLYFPLVEAPAQVAVQSPQPVVQGAGKRILYVDDDDAMIHLVCRILRRNGYQASGQEDAEEALAAVRADPSAFDLVVTDYNMPKLSGVDVARELARIRADLPVMLISGYVTDELREAARQVGVRHIVYKPNTVEELCETIGEAMQGRAPGTVD